MDTFIKIDEYRICWTDKWWIYSVYIDILSLSLTAWIALWSIKVNSLQSCILLAWGCASVWQDNVHWQVGAKVSHRSLRNYSNCTVKKKEHTNISRVWANIWNHSLLCTIDKSTSVGATWCGIEVCCHWCVFLFLVLCAYGSVGTQPHLAQFVCEMFLDLDKGKGNPLRLSLCVCTVCV